MLSWSDLDLIDHFAWGLSNGKNRGNCAEEVSIDTLDTLVMVCGEEVGLNFVSIVF